MQVRWNKLKTNYWKNFQQISQTSCFEPTELLEGNGSKVYSTVFKKCLNGQLAPSKALVQSSRRIWVEVIENLNKPLWRSFVEDSIMTDCERRVQMETKEFLSIMLIVMYIVPSHFQAYSYNQIILCFFIFMDFLKVYLRRQWCHLVRRWIYVLAAQDGVSYLDHLLVYGREQSSIKNLRRREIKNIL